MNESLPRYEEDVMELVGPIRRVVEIAIAKVRKGEVDDLGRQKLILENKSGKLFEITDIFVEETTDGIKSSGNLDNGLFISEVDRFGHPKKGLDIQIPRCVEAVNEQTLYSLREIPPKQIVQLIRELF